MKKLRTVLLVFFAALLVLSACKIAGTLSVYIKGRNSYSSLEQYVSFATRVPDPTAPAAPSHHASASPPAPTATPAADDTLWPEVDFDELARINPDVVAWLYIEGTDINYPVVQGEDNEFYLKHLFDGSRSGAGCLFLDAGCAADFSDRHSVIHGHHMKDNSMFARLVEYKKQKHYDEHPTALLLTPEYNYKIQLFSGYVADAKSSAWKRIFPENSSSDWLRGITARSLFTPQHLPTPEDRIVSFSTCTYEYNDARFVLHGFVQLQVERNP